MDSLCLCDMKATGRFFTWSNRHVCSRIDRAICNDKWTVKYGSITAHFRKNFFSDHTPIHIETTIAGSHSRKQFRFLNVLVEDEKFIPTVANIWSHDIQGTEMYKVWSKLKLCKELLKQLQSRDLGSIDIKMDETRSKLLDIQAMTPTNATPDLLDKEKEALEDMYKWLSIQEKINKQKSKAHWIKERDGNNKYFFNCMKARASTNNISMLKGENGTLLHKQTEIEIEILNYYKGLLGAAVETLPAVNLNIMRQGPSLSQQQQRDMCTKITMEEIEIDLFDINDNKTPWIDGFNAYFFKKTWRIVQNDIYKVVLDFFQHNKLLRAVNYTMVTLIPKSSHPETLFLLPKKVIKMIEAICMSFLWTGEATVTTRALVAWDKICLPKGARGLNASWMVRKIMTVRKYWQQLGDHSTLVHLGKFQTAAAYKRLRGDVPTVDWKRLVFQNVVEPKQVFTLWMRLHGKLRTKDVILKWGKQVDGLCVFYTIAMETARHMYFDCTFTQEMTRGNSARSALLKASFAVVVYAIWIEKNERILQRVEKTIETLDYQALAKLYWLLFEKGGRMESPLAL
nr:uncharacterized protein LOC108947930 [Nicotiana tomentosiformis]